MRRLQKLNAPIVPSVKPLIFLNVTKIGTVDLFYNRAFLLDSRTCLCRKNVELVDDCKKVRHYGLMSTPERYYPRIDETRACQLAGECMPFSNVAKALGFKEPWEFEEYRKKYPIFDQHLKTARDYGLEDLAFSVLGIVDLYDNANHARAKIDAIKWLCAVMNPQIYGQRIDLTVTQAIDISGLIDASNRRIMRDVIPLPDNESEIY